jgi:sigma-E factor negative regulatory protein RseA
MNMADKEKISALMDGEWVDKAALKELAQDTQGQETWRNYHLIGDVLRGDAPAAKWDIAASVAMALEDEAPHGALSSADVMPIESQPEPKQARRRLPSWLQNFGQVAIAASVCLAVVVGIQTTSQDESAPSATQDAVPVLQTIPFAGSAEPVSLTRQSVEQSQHTQQSSVQEQRRRVNAMLQDYELQLRLNGDAYQSAGE